MEKVFGDEKRGKRKEAGNRTNVRGGRKRPGLSRLLESFDRTSSTKLRKRMETTEKRQARTEEKKRSEKEEDEDEVDNHDVVYRVYRFIGKEGERGGMGRWRGLQRMGSSLFCTGKGKGRE